MRFRRFDPARELHPEISMCGRFTLHHSVEEVAARFAVEQITFDFGPRYNIAPMQPLAVITRGAHGDDHTLLEGYRWGLVPFWAKDEALGAKMINARLETLSEKPSFKTALQRRRCLVPADGFYEWKVEGKSKIPHHVRFRDGRLYAFAGLWDEWDKGGLGPLRTATIVTGPPNGLLSTLHHRMAIIVKPENEKRWLDPDVDADEALSLLEIFPDDELEAFPVDRKVGNVAYDEPGCIVPLESGDEQMSLL